MRYSLKQELDGRQIDTKTIRSEGGLPFSDYIPNQISERFTYDVASSRDINGEDFIDFGEFNFEEAETILDGEADETRVVRFYSDFHPEPSGIFSVYGEASLSDSEFSINSAVFVEGADNVKEAQKEFRDYALASRNPENFQVQEEKRNKQALTD